MRRCNTSGRVRVVYSEIMTDQELINSLYKRFGHQPATLDERHFDLLADYIVDGRGIELDDDIIIFTHIAGKSPLRRIPLRNINGVADLGGLLAIVLHSAIIFFNKQTLAVTVHLRHLTFTQRLKLKIKG